MKKLQTVDVTISFVVYADEDIKSADFKNAVIDGVNDTSYRDYEVDSWSINNRYDLPDGWDLKCMPYGSDDDKTIAELLKEQQK